MSVPTIKTDYLAEAQSLLTSMYQDAPTIKAFLNALVIEIQLLETAANGLIQGCLLENAVGDALDKLGAIVGISRNGLSDADFRVAIQIQIKVNGSMGRAEDILQITALAVDPSLNPAYSESYPAGWQVTIYEILNGIQQLMGYLHHAKAAGTAGAIIYSNWSPSDDIFLWDDYITPLGFEGMSDSLNPDDTALFTSGQSI